MKATGTCTLLYMGHLQILVLGMEGKSIQLICLIPTDLAWMAAMSSPNQTLREDEKTFAPSFLKIVKKKKYTDRFQLDLAVQTMSTYLQ